ncbi:hypothetical protein G6011_05334 [Alternaria panax]|uniref:Uncharacterized protein n=1 Tax=Alternaria panax TaxID=48097 RepID=A0AAD4FCL7_9PLEO|nr:hypothetical protein G6011_05334 [Alternaria panax]
MLGRIKTVVTEAFTEVMGSAELAPPTRSHRHSESHSGDQQFSRVIPEAKSIMDSSGNMQRQSGRDIRDDGNKHSREVSTTKASSSVTAATLQKTLELREQELEVMHAKSMKVLGKFLRLREIRKEQAETIKTQGEEINFRDDVINTIFFDHLEPYAKKNGLQPDEWTRKDLFEVLGSLSREAADAGSYAVKISTLTEQVRMLQKEMFAKVEKVHVASDEQFAQDFRVIASAIKSLSRTICIDDALNVPEILSTGCLLEDVSHHHWTGRPKKKLLVEAWIWSVFMEFVFRTPFAIFGKQCELLNANWQSLYMDGHCHGWPHPTSLSEAWRCTTVVSMLELVDGDVISQGKVQQVHRKLEPDIIAARTNVYRTIGVHLSRISTEAVDPLQVQTIVNKAFAFAMEMSRQLVRLQITFPRVGDKFDSNTMKATPDTDEDVEEGALASIVNPGLTKWGDSHGKNLDHRYDIIPSLVQLEPLSQQGGVELKPGPQNWADVAKRSAAEGSTSDGKNEGKSER